MPRLFFTPHLLKHHAIATRDVAGETVAAALDALWDRQPELRSYVLDDNGRVRQHVMIFVNDAPLRDRERLSDPVTAESEIHVLQALSGG